MARIDHGSCSLFKINDSQSFQRSPETISIEARAVDLDGHPDFMTKEISENGAVVRAALDIDDSKIDAVVDVIINSERTILTGVGTSYYVALMGQYMISDLAGEFTPAKVIGED